MDTFIGFDSAWTDNPRAPGALCGICLSEGSEVAFHPPSLVSFTEALKSVERLRSPTGATLIAIDQPTIVPNATSMRPVERTAASLVSWLGGGVQPSNTGRTGMFCEVSPIWRFLHSLGAVEDPEAARTAGTGLYLMEVFPALALPSLDERFFRRLGAPKYNPGRKRTFKRDDWVQVAEAIAAGFERFQCPAAAGWCRGVATLSKPRKGDQDRLDAALCALIALHWRQQPRTASILLGDLVHGYMVLPASLAVRQRLTAAAARFGVPLDSATIHGLAIGEHETHLSLATRP